MKMQHQAHIAVQKENYDLRLHALQQFLSLYFQFNMHNYAGYGTYHAEVLSQIDTLYPGLKETLSFKSLSIQAQDCYHPRTGIDQRGEQTINRSGKTSGVSGMLPLHHHLY